MTEGEVGAALRDAMVVLLKLGGPALLAALVVGLLISLFQAVTQINEATLAYVPKLLAIAGALALTGPFMLASLTDYTQALFDQMIAIGGQ